MLDMIDKLVGLVTEGNAIMTEPEADPAALQAWMVQRSSVWQDLPALGEALSTAERQAVRALIEEVLALDATLIPRLEARLESLGKELLAARKIRQALGESVAARRSSRLITRAV